MTHFFTFLLIGEVFVLTPQVSLFYFLRLFALSGSTDRVLPFYTVYRCINDLPKINTLSLQYMYLNKLLVYITMDISIFIINTLYFTSSNDYA